MPNTMLNSILLSGHLTDKKLGQALSEFVQITPHRVRPRPLIELVIDSLGGDMQPTINFVECLWANYQTGISGIKIYNAESAAAFIALSINTYREMKEDAVLGIHTGSLILEAVEIDLEDGRIRNEETINRFKSHEIYLKQILSEIGLSSDQKLMAELYGSGWLRLSAEECLRRGIVNRLF